MYQLKVTLIKLEHRDILQIMAKSANIDGKRLLEKMPKIIFVQRSRDCDRLSNVSCILFLFNKCMFTSVFSMNTH